MSVYVRQMFGKAVSEVEDPDNEEHIKNAAQNEYKGTDNVYAHTLFLDIAFCRAVSLSLGRSAYASQRHFITPLNCIPSR